MHIHCFLQVKSWKLICKISVHMMALKYTYTHGQTALDYGNNTQENNFCNIYNSGFITLINKEPSQINKEMIQIVEGKRVKHINETFPNSETQMENKPDNVNGIIKEMKLKIVSYLCQWEG